jgi:hypothetical protein
MHFTIFSLKSLLWSLFPSFRSFLLKFKSLNKILLESINYQECKFCHISSYDFEKNYLLHLFSFWTFLSFQRFFVSHSPTNIHTINAKKCWLLLERKWVLCRSSKIVLHLFPLSFNNSFTFNFEAFVRTTTRLEFY